MTTPADETLLRLARAVADGTPIDWQREAAAQGGLEAQLRQLRILEAMASLHPEPAPDPLIGKTLSHYRIVEQLGAGGMGVVYRAEDMSLRRPVALKVLPPELVGNEERRRRFLREARAAAAVTHPYIAAVYEVREAGGIVFIAMELVEGGTLRALIGGRPLPIRDALRVATEMAEGLAHAHQARVIHRDLKPDNVMIRVDGHVKLLDFGLARLLEDQSDLSISELSKVDTLSGELTRAGRVMGTPAYMSPEQARGEPLDARSDIFSFGSVLYEMATGKPPFRGRTTEETLGAIVAAEPLAPSRLNAEVPPHLEGIIGRCLEKGASERYQDSRDLLAALQETVGISAEEAQTSRPAGAPVAVAPSSGWTQLLKTAGARTGLVGGLIALIAVAGAVLLWKFRPAPAFRSGDVILVADFENLTGRREFDTAVRDAFEASLAPSRFVRVITEERLRQLLAARGRGAATGIDANLADELCGSGGCAGYLRGRIETEGSGYRLSAGLHRVGEDAPAIAVAGSAQDEGEVLHTIHNLALDLRRALGESPAFLSDALPPTTRSLAAFQIATKVPFAGGKTSVDLLRQALAIDPKFVAAYSSLATIQLSYGNMEEARMAAERAFLLSSGLPDQIRLWNEINYLDALYDFDTEVERLRSYVARFPSSADAMNYLVYLHLFIYEDPERSEKFSEVYYRVDPSYASFLYLSRSLGWRGRFDEIEKLVSDFRSKGGWEAGALSTLAWLYAVRLDWQKLQEILVRLPQEIEVREEGRNARVHALLAAGRLAEGERAISEALQATDLTARSWLHRDHLRLAWLHLRRSKQAPQIRPEWVDIVRTSIVSLPNFAAFSAEARVSGPLAQLIQEYERQEKGSKSRFVQEELRFARGCLALIRGEPAGARRLLEPLARGSILVRRHKVLALTYEALGMWSEAAAEYEESLRNPFHKWYHMGNPAAQIVNQFHVARLYDERLGDEARARQWYERFLADWKDGDPDIPELIETRRRLAALTREPSGA